MLLPVAGSLCVEPNDGPDDLAGEHGPERLVELVETERPRHHVVEVESSVQVPTGHLREVLGGDRIPAVRDEKAGLVGIRRAFGAAPPQDDLGGTPIATAVPAYASIYTA